MMYLIQCYFLLQKFFYSERVDSHKTVTIQDEPNKTLICLHTPILVAARSKPWVYGHSLAGIAGSNSSGVMEVCLL